jgi:hypothetical protein
MLDLSAKFKTTSGKMNTRNHHLQWYKVQDNKCSEIISYNGTWGCGGARLQSCLLNGDFGRSCCLDSREEVESREETRSCVFLLFLH